MVTQAGIDLIDIIDEELLKSAKLTGLWENKLRQIERGTYSATAFIDELKMLISEIVHNVLTDNSMKKIDVISDDDSTSADNKAVKTKAAASDAPKKRRPPVKRLEQVECPVCGKGHILKGHTAYGCSEYVSGCTLRLPFSDYPVDITPAKLNALIKKNFKN